MAPEEIDFTGFESNYSSYQFRAIENEFVDIDDHHFFSCDMLKKFARRAAKEAEHSSSAKLGKKSAEKYKRKIASKMMLVELKSMRTEFSQLINLDNSLSHIASDYKSL